MLLRHVSTVAHNRQTTLARTHILEVATGTLQASTGHRYVAGKGGVGDEGVFSWFESATSLLDATQFYAAHI